MRKSMFAAGVAAVMAAALSLPSALQAHDTGSSRSDGGSMMGPGMGKMMEQMGQMMDHCSQMMQGASSRPNEQWRNNSPPTGDRNGRQQ